MHPQGPAAPLGEYGKISAGLRGLDHSEGIFLPGNRQVGSVVAGDLEEYAAVRTALVGLSRGVQETRAETEAGCDLFAVADCRANGLQGRFVFGVHRYVAKDGEVVACSD